MKMAQAMEIMEHGIRPRGFLVAVEKVRGCILESDYFPDTRAGEYPIPSEEQAWQMAQQFAANTRGMYVNIYVVKAEDFTPVKGYQARKIENRW